MSTLIESADQTTLHVDDHGGDGHPVVLLHGWPLSGQAWADQVGPLREAGYRVVTYDRRGFGRSEPAGRYDYDALADDLHRVLTGLDLTGATLVGFSMGGGEVARYVARHGQGRLASVVFAAAIPPYLLQTEDNPDGPLDPAYAQELRSGLETDRDGFFDQFMTGFFSAGDSLQVSEQQRQDALALCRQSDQAAALAAMDAWATTDFREDLATLTVPSLVLHGDSDGVVPLDGSGRRTHAMVEDSELTVLEGAPHGCNTSHPAEFNRALLDFLGR